MSSLTIPRDGLVLVHDQDVGNITPASEGSPHVMRLDLAQHATDDILQSLRNNEQVRLRFGKKPALQFGKKTLALDASTSPFPSELFTKGGRQDGFVYFSGKLSHTLEVQNAQEATAKSDAALATLENTLKSIQEQKASNETSFVRNKEEMRELNKKNSAGHRPSPLTSSHTASLQKDRLLNGTNRSTPSSPFLAAAFSPRYGPTSAPLSSSFPLSEDKIKLDAIKIPLIHLLAVHPIAPRTIAQTLHASKEDCDNILQKVARDCQDSVGKKELKERSYRELDVWKFPYRTQEDRQGAIDSAIQAFDRMRVERRDPLWQLLLPPDERGKGKCLSKLNFGKPVPSHATPGQDSLGHPPEKDLSQNTPNPSNDLRGRREGKEQNSTSRARLNNPQQKKKTNEREALPKHDISKGTPKHSRNQPGRDTPNKQSNTPKLHGKFKSSELIEDSDEELEAAKGVTTKTATTATPATPAAGTAEQHLSPSTKGMRSQVPKPLSSPLPRKSFHKSTLSTSSVPGQSARSTSSRPRTDSSPQKPSPSDSSPPTNSTDLESNSTKASSQSSATSSPPSSSDIPQRKNFSPVVSEARRNLGHGNSPAKRHAGNREEGMHQNVKKSSPGVSGEFQPPIRGRSPTKRKAEPINEDENPPAKRQQVNGIARKPHHGLGDTTQVNGVHHKLPSNGEATGDLHQRPSNDRKVSESESVSSPEKPEQATIDMVENTRRFRKYYERYKELHEKVEKSKEKDEQEVADLWKMHNRLAEMKKEIWDEYHRLGEPPKIVLS